MLVQSLWTVWEILSLRSIHWRDWILKSAFPTARSPYLSPKVNVQYVLSWYLSCCWCRIYFSVFTWTTAKSSWLDGTIYHALLSSSVTMRRSHSVYFCVNSQWFRTLSPFKMINEHCVTNFTWKNLISIKFLLRANRGRWGVFIQKTNFLDLRTEAFVFSSNWLKLIVLILAIVVTFRSLKSFGEWSTSPASRRSRRQSTSLSLPMWLEKNLYLTHPVWHRASRHNGALLPAVQNKQNLTERYSSYFIV